MKRYSKNDTLLLKCHILPKMSYSSENGTFLQKWHIPPKMAHSSKNVTFLQICHIPPKMYHSSKNRTFLKKGRFLKNCTFLQKWPIQCRDYWYGSKTYPMEQTLKVEYPYFNCYRSVEFLYAACMHCTVQPHASIANFPNLDFMLIFEKFRLF